MVILFDLELEQLDVKVTFLICTPLATYFRLSLNFSLETKEDKEHMSGVTYTSVVESIMNVMVYTRPNISHVVSVVIMVKFTRRSLDINEYFFFLEALNVGLLYDRGSSTRGSVENFVDSYFASSLNMKGSLTCYVFTHLECVISWKAILKFIVALSITENKFMALTRY